MTFSYVVQKGDTLFRIARRQGINKTALYNANPHLHEGQEHIYPGEILQIPQPSARLYVVQAGDTTYSVAGLMGISPEALQAANPNIDPHRLAEGQTLLLPACACLRIINPVYEYGYQELVNDIGLLLERYPFLTVENIGSSVLGCAIPAVRLGRGPREIHYNGSFHANEWITSLLLMKFAEDAAEAYRMNRRLRGRNVRELFEHTSLWIVPMVNPDGVELVHRGAAPDNPYRRQLLEWNDGSPDFSGWKANIRGVDLNDQFPAHWERERARREVAGPGPRDYTGESPLSEPEAQAMAEFTQAHDFRLVIAFHTQGQEIYWNYRDMEPPEAEPAARRLARVSRYRAVKLTESDAGYKDWFIQEYRRSGFTVEAGIGTNPLPLSQFRAMYDEALAIMLEAFGQ